MIAMRDGVKLHTVILVPRGASHAPILLTRTPYDASATTTYAQSAHLAPSLNGYDNAQDVIIPGGYIRVVQDIRGKYGSEGDYLMNRPLLGPLNSTSTDESTDTWDTIDYLVKNIPETNGKVGELGISYDGVEPLMGLVNPHPALKVSVPMNPMVDGWMGDDWFHNGAFRQQNIPYILEQEATRDNSVKWWTDHFDDYDAYLSAGSAGDIAKNHGVGQVGFWNQILAHPAYDSWWHQQTMDKILAVRTLLEETTERMRREAGPIYSRELAELIFVRPYCRISHIVEAGLAKRQTASAYLKHLTDIGILREHKVGREKVFLNPAFIELLKRD